MLEDEYKLSNYLNIGYIIESLEKEKQKIANTLYQQNLTTHLFFSDMGIYTAAPKIDRLVAENIEACNAIDKRIERWKLRQRYFINYLKSLSERQRKALNRGLYSENLYRKTMEEIKQIEIAVSFHEGYFSLLDEEDDHILSFDEFLEKTDEMAEVFSL